MEQTQQTETPLVKRKLCLGSLSGGALGVGLALWAIKVDAVNNYHFGVQQAGEEGGQLLIIAALALAVVPMLAAIVPAGWDRFLRIVFWASAAATVIAAINAYGVKQGAEIERIKGDRDRYEQSQQDRTQALADIAKAQAEADGIAEMVPAAELQRQYDEAKAQRDAEANDVKRGAKCGNLCREAEKKMDALSPRIGLAGARDRALDRVKQAQARVDVAKAEGKAGPKDQVPIAKAIASWTGTTAEDAASKISLVMAVMMIVISVSAGLIFDHSFQAIRKGLGFGVGTTPEPPKATATKARKPVILAALSDDERLDYFIKSEALPILNEKQLSSKQLHALLEEWWMQRLPGIGTPSQRRLAERLKAAGLRSVKVRGVMTYGAALAAA